MYQAEAQGGDARRALRAVADERLRTAARLPPGRHAGWNLLPEPPRGGAPA